MRFRGPTDAKCCDRTDWILRRRLAASAWVLAAWAVADGLPAYSEPHAYAVPFVPSADTARQGFVRIINQSEDSGDVRVTPIDDSGRRYPLITIHLDPLAAVHFNSSDLENGNSAKGLSRGVGSGAGDWRLEVEADFQIEALAYVRTSDGFVTSIFEAGGWWDVDVYWLPFFNPGSNRNQVSRLRLVNPKNEAANVVIVGIDDRGSAAPDGRIEISLPPRASRTITARELEEGSERLSGRFGDGAGKWRLWVKSDRRLHVLSLLESPTGNLTNLSTGAWWNRKEAPMVLSADPEREGFVRVINNSRQGGEISVRAVDDSGRTHGPIALSIRPFAAAHFNSTDLANGNPDKGLSAGIGSYEGDVRLEFETDLVITPLAYVRTSDGFVTSVHDLPLSNADGTWLSIVNPGSNRNQESLVRIINRDDEDNGVEIWGRDDDGSYATGGTVSLSLPANSARTISARELEQGADGLAGRLGDGRGKWTLFLKSDEPIHAMSLLNSPTGNLTNLSATPYTQRLRITNAPVAHDISISTDLSSPYIEVQLLATDPDGDSIAYWLEGSHNGEGYEAAHVEWGTGKLSATMSPEDRESVRIPYRATDGNEWSDRAYVNVSIEDSDEEEGGLGAQDIDPEAYAKLPKAYFDPAVLSDYEDGHRSLPRSLDLSGNFPVPGNQGTQNSCVGWAVSYLKSYQERLEERWEFRNDTRFSPAWIYNQINNGRDEGSHPLNAMQLVNSKGAATLATMPYDASDYLTQPSARASDEAGNFLGGEIKTVNSLQQYKAALAHRVPFVLAMPVYPSLFNLSGSSSAYVDLSGDLRGGHAVAVVGYDEDHFGGAFKVLNSWGSGWGDRGFFWIPYDTFRHRNFSSVYAITIEDLPNGEVSRPVVPSRPACGATDEQRPNLTISSWYAEYQPQQGGEGRWQWRVVNNGTAAAPAGVDVNLLLSTDRRINSADHWVIYEEIPFALEPGGGAYRDEDNERRFTFPETIPPGTYYMAMWVDDIQEVRECDEKDNVLIGEKVVELRSTKPDLTATSWYAKWDALGNGTLEYRVENIGTVATMRADWWITLLLHTHPDIALGDRYDLFSEQAAHILAPRQYVYRDASNPASFHLRDTLLDGWVPAGIYYMTLWVDDLDHVDESNELNNQSFSSGFVVVSDGRSSGQISAAGIEPFMSPSVRDVRPEKFNGRLVPGALTRRVEIIENGDGTRRFEFLDQDTDPDMSFESRIAYPVGIRESDDPSAVLTKRNYSADIVTGPVREARPMPR